MPQAALQRIRQLGLAGRFYITPHARERMAERGVEPADVQHGLTQARTAVWQPEHASWKVRTVDLVGDDLTLAVVIEASAIVVTVF